MSNLAINAFWSTLSHVMHRGSLMLCGIILARNLTTDGFAAYSYFNLTIAMLATYFAMGLGVTASRFFAEVDGRKNVAELPPIGLLMGISGGMGFIAFSLVMLLPDAIIKSGLDIPKLLIAGGVGVAVLGIVPSGGILGLEKYQKAALVSSVSAVVMLGMVFHAVRNNSPIIGMCSIIAGLMVQAIGQTAVIVKTIGWPVMLGTGSWSKLGILKIFSFAGPMLIVSIMAGSSTWIVGRLILNGSGEDEFGLYAIGLQWFALGLLLPGMLSRVVLPRLVRSKSGEGKAIVRSGAAMAFWLASIFFIISLLFSPWLALIYGGQYESVRYIVPAFLVVSIINAPINTIGNAIVAKNGQILWMLFTSLSFSVLIFLAASNVVLNSMSAILAHGMAALIMLFLTYFYASKRGLI